MKIYLVNTNDSNINNYHRNFLVQADNKDQAINSVYEEYLKKDGYKKCEIEITPIKDLLGYGVPKIHNID